MKEIDATIEALEKSQDYVEASSNAKMLAGWGEQLDRAEAALAGLRSLTAKQGEQEAVIHQHGFAKENSTLRTINESLDQQLDEVMRERDERDDVIDKLLDIVLGADRYEWSSHYGFTDAIAEVEERMAHPAPVNQQLLEALKQLVIATKHLNPCPGTLEMAEKAIKEAEGEVRCDPQR